ncbi:MAG: GFA family protein [Myxococcales bacterium]|nr:GFA family protein [Myxococcales bacterium]
MSASAGPELAGGCQCGAVRYRIERAAILTLYACHCRECQRQSASAFALSLKIPRPAFELETSGELGSWSRSTDRGGRSRAFFCPACGSRILHDTGDSSAWVSLKAGLLDDIANLTPVGHIWTARALPWVRFGPDDLIFERQPESYEPLIEAWRRLRRAG